MALASILGPFGVHLLKFTLDTHPGSWKEYLGLLEILVRTQGVHTWYLCDPGILDQSPRPGRLRLQMSH